MRVIAGQYRSRTLLAPRGLATRPTSDRLRETLFNVLAPRLDGARFLDLYAGSGANGIEALSRGAAAATFVEQAPEATAAIRANLAALRISPEAANVEARSVKAWLLRAAALPTTAYDLIFLDPPYDADVEYQSTLAALGGTGQSCLAPDGWVVAEHRRARPGQPALAPRYGVLERTRLLQQGDVALSFFLRVTD